MIDEEELAEALETAMLANPALGSQEGPALTAFAEALASVIAEFCAPLES